MTYDPMSGGTSSKAGIAFLAALEACLEELNREAEAATEMDPLQEISFFLRRDETRVEAVASYMSGHGGESAHVLEDRVHFTLSGEEALDVAFERAMFPELELPRVPLSGQGGRAFLSRIEAFLRASLP